MSREHHGLEAGSRKKGRGGGGEGKDPMRGLKTPQCGLVTEEGPFLLATS